MQMLCQPGRDKTISTPSPSFFLLFSSSSSSSSTRHPPAHIHSIYLAFLFHSLTYISDVAERHLIFYGCKRCSRRCGRSETSPHFFVVADSICIESVFESVARAFTRQFREVGLLLVDSRKQEKNREEKVVSNEKLLLARDKLNVATW